ncbi:Protein MAIN-LIKE 2, partial [Linum perenne]
PDPKIIIALVGRWRSGTNTFHLYHNEETITLEDMHFLTDMSVDGLLVASDKHIPSALVELTVYVELCLGKKPSDH